MQPDPTVFLPAIRRAVLRKDLLEIGLKEGLSAILMHRAGEGLAHLALRHGPLPSMLRGLRTRQRALLRRGIVLIEAAGLAMPVNAATALAHPVGRGRAGEEDIQGYELLVDGISSMIAALSARSLDTGAAADEIRKLGRAASRLELDMRAAYKAALAELKTEMDSRTDGTSNVAVPPNDANLTAILRKRFPELADIEARGVRRLPGVNAQEIYFLELLNHPEWAGPMVMRRASGFNPTRAQMADEFDLLRYLHGHGLPVPAVLMVERDPATLGGVFLIMKRLPGATRTAESLAGDGRSIALSMAQVLAKVHQVDVQALSGPHRDDGESIQGRMRKLIDRFYDRWRAERIEGSLALEAAYAWMRENLACLQGPVSLVHGDCNFRNILLDGNRVSALLDWELSHLGSAAEDLSYIRADIEKTIPWADFLAAYENAGGTVPAEAALRYFTVWSDVWRTSMAASVYAGYLRGEHDNFIFATVSFNEYYTTLDDLAAFMANA